MAPRTGSIPGAELGVGTQLCFSADERSVAREPGLLDRGSVRVDVLADGRVSESLSVLEQLFAVRTVQVVRGDEGLPVRH